MSEHDDEIPSYFLMSGLLHAYYWMDESLQNHLRAAGLPELSRTQSLIMTNIADGVTRPAELARRLGITRQAVQQLLADMQERKLVVLKPDPDDARAKIVHYNPRGREIGVVSMLALERIDAVIESRIGRKGLLELRRLLLAEDWGPPVTATTEQVKARSNRKRPPLELVARRAQRLSVHRPGSR